MTLSLGIQAWKVNPGGCLSGKLRKLRCPAIVRHDEVELWNVTGSGSRRGHTCPIPMLAVHAVNCTPGFLLVVCKVEIDASSNFCTRKTRN